MHLKHTNKALLIPSGYKCAGGRQEPTPWLVSEETGSGVGSGSPALWSFPTGPAYTLKVHCHYTVGCCHPQQEEHGWHLLGFCSL
jgi:hypothetical protein